MLNVSTKKIAAIVLLLVSVGLIAYACTKTSRICAPDGIDPAKEPIQISYTNPGPTMRLTLKLNRMIIGGVYVDVLDSNGTVVVNNMPCAASANGYICQIKSEIISQLPIENSIQIPGFSGNNTVNPKKIILNLKNAANTPLIGGNAAKSQVVSYVPLCGIPNVNNQSTQPITDGIADCAEKFSQSATQGGMTLDLQWKLAGMVLQEDGLAIYQIWARTGVSSLNHKITEAGQTYALMSDYVVPNTALSLPLQNFCQANGITTKTDAKTAQLEFAPIAGTPAMLASFFTNVIQDDAFGCNASQYIVNAGINGYSTLPINTCANLNMNKEAKGYPLFQTIQWNLADYDNIIGNWYSWASSFIPVEKNLFIWSKSISSKNSNYTYAVNGSAPYLLEMDVNIGAAVRCVGVTEFSKDKKCN